MKKADMLRANKFARAVVKSGIPVHSIYLFGSRVNGNAQRWSDLDTCVVSPQFGKDRISERVLLLKIARPISALIEPHPFSVEEFADNENPLAQEVQKTGVRVV